MYLITSNIILEVFVFILPKFWKYGVVLDFFEIVRQATMLKGE